MRTVAWQRFQSFKRMEQPTGSTAALKDRDQGVRNAVVNTLRGRISPINKKTMGSLVSSPYEDVRKFLAESMARAESDAVYEHGLKLTDEDANVRAATIRSFGELRTPGWLKIMERSLMMNMNLACCHGCFICGTSAWDSHPQEVFSKNPNSRISSMIRIELQRGNSAMKFKLLFLSFFMGFFVVSFVNAQDSSLVPRKWSSSDAIDEKPKWHSSLS